MKTKIIFTIILIGTASVLNAGTATPTDYEQYMLELINRGRLDPDAVAARYGISLNEGLSAGTISSDAKQPLAFDEHIIKAARDHSQWLLNNGLFQHAGPGGNSPGDRMTADGYSWTTYGENIAIKTSSSLSDSDVSYLHELLFVDEGVVGRGHRKNLMNSSFESVGLGVLNGYTTLSGWNRNASIVTEDFGANSSGPFITGVAYTDSNSDNFYSPGEGINNVTVTAKSSADTFTTKTWDSGGYTLEVSAGTYEVTFSGGDLASPIVHNNIAVSSKNVKVDSTGESKGKTTKGILKVINKKKTVLVKAFVDRSGSLNNQAVSVSIGGTTVCSFSGAWDQKKKVAKLSVKDTTDFKKCAAKIKTDGKKAGTIIIKCKRNDKSDIMESGAKTVIVNIGSESYEADMTFTKGKAKM